MGWIKAGLRLDWTRVEAGSPEGQPGPARPPRHRSADFQICRVAGFQAGRACEISTTADWKSVPQSRFRIGRNLHHEIRLALNCFNIHAAILPEAVELQKPTVGFSARFFLEGSHRWNILSYNLLRGIKSPKIEKTRKKVSFFWSGPPVFLPNGPQKSLFFAVSTFCERGRGRL